MNKDNASRASDFYTAMSKKNVTDLGQYLHEDIEFTAPLAQTHGKDAYLENVQKFTGFFNSLKIRTICSSANEVTVVYDLNFPEPIGKVPSVALMNFIGGLIIKIELFYDARPFNM